VPWTRKLGNVETYFAVDVPNWIRSHLQVADEQRLWAIGGFSQGGTCALQLAVRTPDVYPNFVDISGSASRRWAAAGRPSTAPSAGTAPRSLGSTRWNCLPRNDSRPARDDRGRHARRAVPAGRQGVFEACRRAGMDVHLTELPGGHTWAVWRPGLQHALPWLAHRLGLVRLIMFSRLGRLIRRAPGTTALAVLLWVIGGATGSLVSGPSPALLQHIGLVTDTLQRRAVVDPGDLDPVVRQTWPATWSRRAAVRRAGACRAPARPAAHRAVLPQQPDTRVAGRTALVRLGADAGLWWYTSVDGEHALGPSVGIAGVSLALSYRLPALWLRRVRVFVLVALIMMTLYVGSFEDILRLTGALAGLVIGWPCSAGPGAGPGWTPVRAETRTLIAIWWPRPRSGR